MLLYEISYLKLNMPYYIIQILYLFDILNIGIEISYSRFKISYWKFDVLIKYLILLFWLNSLKIIYHQVLSKWRDSKQVRWSYGCNFIISYFKCYICHFEFNISNFRYYLWLLYWLKIPILIHLLSFVVQSLGITIWHVGTNRP